MWRTMPPHLRGHLCWPVSTPPPRAGSHPMLLSDRGGWANTVPLDGLGLAATVVGDRKGSWDWRLAPGVHPYTGSRFGFNCRRLELPARQPFPQPPHCPSYKQSQPTSSTSKLTKSKTLDIRCWGKKKNLNPTNLDSPPAAVLPMGSSSLMYDHRK